MSDNGQLTTEKSQSTPNKLRKGESINLTFEKHINPDFYAVESVDVLAPAEGHKTTTLLTYPDNGGVAGIINHNKNHDVVTIGFPFETIQNADARQRLMELILKSLNR